jgi:anti-anti-sigma factor
MGARIHRRPPLETDRSDLELASVLGRQTASLGCGLRGARSRYIPPVESSFRVDVRSQNRTAVVVVSGELDVASGPTLEQELAGAEASDAQLVILDLRALEFIDSTGLSILIKAHQQAEASGRRFAVVRGRSQVQRLLGLTGLEERLTLVDSPEELLGVAEE